MAQQVKDWAFSLKWAWVQCTCLGTSICCTHSQKKKKKVLGWLNTFIEY